MSLLLDALKKAALQKQFRDHPPSSDRGNFAVDTQQAPDLQPGQPRLVSESPTTASRQEAQSIATTADETFPDSVELSFDIDFDELVEVDDGIEHGQEHGESHPQSGEQPEIGQRRGSPGRPEKNTRLELSIVENTQPAKAPELNATAAAQSPLYPHTSGCNLSKPAAESSRGNTLDNTQPADEPTPPADHRNGAPDGDVRLPADAQSTITSAEDPQKAALAQLLEKSKVAIVQKRRRAYTLGALCIAVVLSLIGFYAYLVWLDGASVFAPPLPEQSFLPVEPGMPAVDTGLESGSAQAGAVGQPQVEPTTAEPTQSPLAMNSATAPSIDSGRAVSSASEQTSVVESSAGSPPPRERARKDNHPSAPASPPRKKADTQSNEPAAPVVRDKSPQAHTEPAFERPKNAGPSALRIQRQERTDPLSEAVHSGYQAYQAGDLESAREAYARALSLDPHSRDALLGAAAVAVRQGRLQQALIWYQQRLARDPKDNYARAGLLAMAGIGQPDPGLESEINLLLREFPEAAHLHFLKGSVHAGGHQWSAAKTAFFDAWSRDPSNPDYAFNLAVALDHLHQPREALYYYNLALKLNTGNKAAFASADLIARILELEAATQ